MPSEDDVDLVQLQQESQSDAVEDFGTPILELFLKRNAQGELHQQGTALKMPDAPQSELNLSMSSESLQVAFSVPAVMK